MDFDEKNDPREERIEKLEAENEDKQKRLDMLAHAAEFHRKENEALKKRVEELNRWRSEYVQGKVYKKQLELQSQLAEAREIISSLPKDRGEFKFFNLDIQEKAKAWLEKPQSA